MFFGSYQSVIVIEFQISLRTIQRTTFIKEEIFGPGDPGGSQSLFSSNSRSVPSDPYFWYPGEDEGTVQKVGVHKIDNPCIVVYYQ